MEKVLYYVLTRLFMAIALFVISSLSVSAQRFETHKVFLSDNVGQTRTIKIKPATKFSIKKDNRYTWAKYEEQKAAVKITLNANTSKNNRSCNFVLLDETNTPVDTLEVIQLGKVSTTVSKVAGSSTTRSKSATSTKRPHRVHQEVREDSALLGQRREHVVLDEHQQVVSIAGNITNDLFSK